MQKIGIVSDKIQKTIKIQSLEDNSIYLGDTNIEHMKSSHPEDYQKYGSELENILNNPDYIGLNPKDNSLEYVKEFNIDNEYVKVAVRVSSSSKYYARSMYILNNNRVNDFIRKGTLKSC